MLARLLTPTEFGIYAIALFAFNFIRVFGEVGLGASLIRSDKEPSQAEYASIYTVQQVLVVGAVILFWFLAPWIVQQYDLAASYIWLLRLVALSLVAISFMVIPQIQLERSIEFDKLAIVEVAQTAVFNVVAVVLAYKGFGAFALGWGFLARTVTGAILVNIIQPWSISFQFNWQATKKHLKFGASYQATSLIGTLNSAVNPILIAMIFGVAKAGYVEWAILLVGYLQRPIVLLNRLLFPTYSKVRTNIEKLTRSVNYTYVVCAIIFFALAGLVVGLAPEIVHIVYTDKWLPALSLLYLLVGAKVLIPMAIPNGSLGYSLGWANTILYLNIAKSIILWMLVIAFIAITESYIAYGYAMIVTQCLHLLLYYLLKKELPNITILKTQLLFFVAAAGTAFTLIQLANFWLIDSFVYLFVALAAGGIIYVLYSVILYLCYYWFTKDDQIFQSIRFLYISVMKKIGSHN